MNAKRLYFVLLGLCFLLSGALIAGTYYGDKFLAKQASRIAIARADEELVDQKKRIKKDLEQKITDLDEVESLAIKFLPDNKNQDILIAELNNIAKENKITINTIKFDASTGGPSVTSQTQALKDTKGVLILPFSVETRAFTFVQLIDFLQDIENNRRKMQVTHISVKPVTDNRDPDYGKLGLSELRIEVYLKGSNETATTGAKPAATPPPQGQ